MMLPQLTLSAALAFSAHAKGRTGSAISSNESASHAAWRTLFPGAHPTSVHCGREDTLGSAAAKGTAT